MFEHGTGRSVTTHEPLPICRWQAWKLLKPGAPSANKRFIFKLIVVIVMSRIPVFLYGQEQSQALPDFSLTMTGDSEIVTPARAHQSEPGFMEVVDAVRKGDAAFTNLEVALTSGEGVYPGGASRAQWHPTNPQLLKELQWMGFNLFGAANNHVMDYGIGGLLEAIKTLKADDAVFAGMGENLGKAREPAFLSTQHGRVALVTCASSFPSDSPAGPSRPDAEGRPGISPLRYETRYLVNPDEFSSLQKISSDLKLETTTDQSSPEKTLSFTFPPYSPYHSTVTFELSDTPGVISKPDPKDLAAIAHSVRDAREMADYVVASIHAHEGTPGLDPSETPPQFLVDYAHAMIDAGADVVVGSGPHLLRGIEIYKGKIIFYSLGNFIFENWIMASQPEEFYERYGVGADALPADGYDARSDHGRRDEPANPLYWQAVVARLTFHNGRPAAVTLTPISTGFGKKTADQGFPEVPDVKKSTEILEYLQKLSDPYGTKIAISNGIGTITIQE
jgi:poly-gamma-glutamate capsule biosynthesis protein CapA/YwtB (metallophosphatase superfamily)